MGCLDWFFKFTPYLVWIEVSDSYEKWPSLPLMSKRRILGILIPLLNVPLFAWNFWQTLLELQGGMRFTDIEFAESLLVLGTTLALSLMIPRVFPVYESKYLLGEADLKLSRFMKGSISLLLKNIERVELFLRVHPEISEDAKKYAMDSSAQLRKAGFKFKDYTNSEDIILNLFVGQNVYMISPKKPKTLIKELKKRNKRLTAKIVELHSRGKRVQELGRS